MRKNRRRTTVAPMSLFAFQDIVTSVTGVILLVAMAMAIQVASAPARERTESTAADYEQVKAELASAKSETSRLLETIKAAEETLGAAASMAPGATVEERAKLEREIERIDAELQSMKEDLAAQQRRRDQTLADLAASDLATKITATQTEIARVEDKLQAIASGNQMLFNVPDNLVGRVHLVEIFPDCILIAKGGVEQRPLIFEGHDSVEEAIDEMQSSDKDDRWILFAHPGTTEQLNAARKALKRLNRVVGFDLLPDSVTVVDPVLGAP